jgi:predicted lipase
MHKLILLFALVLLAVPASAQTTKKEIRKACSAEAKEKGLKSDEAKKFREECLQTRIAALPATEKKLTPQQEKMKTCSAEAKAKGLKGKEYKTFRNECLRAKKS